MEEKLNENFRPRITAVTFSQYQVTGDMQDEVRQSAQTRVKKKKYIFSRQYEMCSAESVDLLTACLNPETKLLTVKGTQENLSVSRSFVEIC